MDEDDEVAKRRATIYDVARVAGVSPSTVSRAFSRPGRVSSTTARRIHEVATQLGYRSGEVFRIDPPTRRHTVGLAVSDLTNPVNFGIIRGVETAAAHAGYTVLLADSQDPHRIEREMLGRIMPHIDGLVIGSSGISDTQLRMLARSVPVSVLNRIVSGLPSVLPDTGRGMRRAVEHLAELGHTRLCYLAGPEASWADGARWRALREAALELGLQEQRIGPYPPTLSAGAGAAEAVLRAGHRAVIAYNDLMAMGLIRALVRMGVTVPDDVSIVGFDNIFAADLISPGLTTVAAPLMNIGEAAANTVITMAGGGHRGPANAPIIVPMRLIVRGSTTSPNARPRRGVPGLGRRRPASVSRHAHRDPRAGGGVEAHGEEDLRSAQA